MGLVRPRGFDSKREVRRTGALELKTLGRDHLTQ